MSTDQPSEAPGWFTCPSCKEVMYECNRPVHCCKSIESNQPKPEPSAEGNAFGHGVVSMARNTKPVVEMLRSGRWTLEQFDQWLDAVIGEKPMCQLEVLEKLMEQK